MSELPRLWGSERYVIYDDDIAQRFGLDAPRELSLGACPYSLGANPSHQAGAAHPAMTPLCPVGKICVTRPRYFPGCRHRSAVFCFGQSSSPL